MEPSSSTAISTPTPTPTPTPTETETESQTDAAAAAAAAAMGGARLIVVSNRLPVTLEQKGSDWSFKLSSGGLVSALSGLKREMSFTWVGWPGKDFGAEDRAKIDRLLGENSCSAVYLDDETAEQYYNGFANSILWPLFHYHPGEMMFEEAAWGAYQRANAAFAAALAAVVEEGDLVWIQDYHLMLLPRMLRELLDGSGRGGVKIGWFLHTPFPSSELYRILPVRRQILEGVLAADLLGFHTYDYARHFLSSCTRILGLATTGDAVDAAGRVVRVGTFPIGIDPGKFSEALRTDAVRRRLGELERRFAGERVVVGVDRLDYIKGVPQKLLAFEQFLSQQQQQQQQQQGAGGGGGEGAAAPAAPAAPAERVVLVQVAVPSRGDVEEYRQLIGSVNELVGRINGRFGTVEYTPIHFLHRSVAFAELVALYAVADVCLITSTRDGMNLVSYEYVATQAQRHGVLVLSEFAGAAQSLDGALIVNAWNIEEVAGALAHALAMPAAQREASFRTLHRYVARHTAAAWGAGFIAELTRVCRAADAAALLPPLPAPAAQAAFRAAARRLLVLDYDGTLSATRTIPEFARPSPLALRALQRLADAPGALVYVVSGRTRADMERWFRGVGVGLAAEHGLFYRHPPAAAAALGLAAGWLGLPAPADPLWRDAVLPLLQHYAARTPGSFVELKEAGVTWHFRNADPEFGEWQASELRANLERVLAHRPLAIVCANKAVEVRPARVDKPAAVRAIVAELPAVDFVLAAGDGRADEPVFAYLAQEFAHVPLFTATVGRKPTAARYYVQDVDAVLSLLAKLTE
ncbi:Trehalose-6-P synthase/phosphatase complex synthase subunit [Coemansia sp. RSA 2050]|nr:Trehalose-6-P synthase/phosphatase complex synthase subunit [Coemansia sp. RSA 2050]